MTTRSIRGRFSVTHPRYCSGMTDEKPAQTKAPAKAFRKGMTLVELIRKFPDNPAAEAWITSIRWPDGPECPHCGCGNVQFPTAHRTMPYRCRGSGCRRLFSVRGMFGKSLPYAELTGAAA